MKIFLVFYLTYKKLINLDEKTLKKDCINLKNYLKFDDDFDIDSLDLFLKLKVLKQVLAKKISILIEILNYIKILNYFPN
jgi:hypothetical protein